MRLVGSQGLADGDDEKRVVGRDAEARRLQQLALYLQVEGAGQSTQQIVSRRPGHVMDNKSEVLSSENLCVNSH